MQYLNEARIKKRDQLRFVINVRFLQKWYASVSSLTLYGT